MKKSVMYDVCSEERKCMRVLVTGVAGQLGHDVMNELYRCGYEGIGTDLRETYEGIEDGTPVNCAPYYSLDITQPEDVLRVVEEVHPDAVIHCAAWTAVDAAEEEENLEKVTAVNVVGTRNLANACAQMDCRMMYISTDYVFDGQGERPWEPDCREYAPLNVYGKTKLEGELAVKELVDKFFIVRIAWVFGKNGNNFIRTMLRLGKNHDHLSVVNDQIGTPTYTLDLARLLVEMIASDQYGYYHATNEGGYISWYEFACEIFKQAAAMGYEQYDEKHLTVTAVSTEEYGVSKAKRPFNSRLSKKKLEEHGFTLLPTWQDALHRYLKEIKPF